MPPTPRTLAAPGGRRRVVLDATPGVVLSGEPAELLLYAFGRTGAARVEVSGPQDAVARFRSTPLSV